VTAQDGGSIRAEEKDDEERYPDKDDVMTQDQEVMSFGDQTKLAKQWAESRTRSDHSGQSGSTGQDSQIPLT
jgi:hypothetical protein